MYCRAIVCDFDGTGATDGHPAPELYAALAAARGHGIVTFLPSKAARLGRLRNSCELRLRLCRIFETHRQYTRENSKTQWLCRRNSSSP